MPKTAGNDLDYITKLPLERVNCNICEIDDAAVLIREHSNLVKCKSCGLVYFNPRPTKEALIQYYNSELGYASCLRETKEPKSFPSDYFNRSLGTAAKLTGKKESLLDVGSGYGNFTLYAKSQGWKDLHGVELSVEAADFVRKKGISISTGTLRDANYPDEKFNLVNMDHVLEHVPDPSADLAEVARILKKGGITHVCVPNISSFSFFIQRKRWVFKSFPNHLYYFSPSSLAKILSKVGLKVIDLKTTPMHSANVEEKILSSFWIPKALIPGFVSYILKKNWGASITCIARKPA